MRINDLKPFVDKTVTLRVTDGETAKLKVNFVDEEYDDIIAAVLETSRPSTTAHLALYTPLPQETSYPLNCRSKPTQGF
jgi:hypothetical protein